MSGTFPSYRLMTESALRQLAASVDMLAALKAARDWRGRDGDGISDPVRQRILDTIAKATGDRE